MIQSLKIIAITLVGLAILCVVALWAFQRFGVYQFSATPVNAVEIEHTGAQIASFTSEDGQEVRAWIADGAPEQPVIVTFYGNFSSTDRAFARLQPLQDAGYTMVMLQYRSANGAPGAPSEEVFAADARALHDQLDDLLGRPIPPSQRVIHGMSLGAAVAGRLASERPNGAVILEAAPERLCRFWSRRYRGLPLCAVMWRERHDLIDRVSAIDAPLVLIHGDRDAAIPLHEAEALAATAGAPLIVLEGGGHADLQNYGLFETMETFLSGALTPR